MESGNIQFCLAPGRKYLEKLSQCGNDPRIVESDPDYSTGRVPYRECPPYPFEYKKQIQ